MDYGYGAALKCSSRAAFAYPIARHCIGSPYRIAGVELPNGGTSDGVSITDGGAVARIALTNGVGHPACEFYQRAWTRATASAWMPRAATQFWGEGLDAQAARLSGVPAVDDVAVPDRVAVGEAASASPCGGRIHFDADGCSYAFRC